MTKESSLTWIRTKVSGSKAHCDWPLHYKTESEFAYKNTIALPSLYKQRVKA